VTTQPVEWRDLTDRPAAPTGQPYKLLAGGPTTGVFPGALAVARVAAIGQNAAPPGGLALNMLPPVDFLAWNSVFDDFRDISEVFPLNHMAMDGAPITSASLVETTKALGAELLLVYAENRDGAQNCELRGVVYDVKHAQPLASIETVAHVAAPIADNARIDRDERGANGMAADPRQIAVKQFQEMARECMLALRSNDHAGPRVAPEGWVPNVPIEPLEWPPPPAGSSSSQESKPRRERARPAGYSG
jgi:hypothetical protein